MPLGLALAALLSELLGTGSTLLLAGVATAPSLLDSLMRALARQPAPVEAPLSGEISS